MYLPSSLMWRKATPPGFTFWLRNEGNPPNFFLKVRAIPLSMFRSMDLESTKKEEGPSLTQWTNESEDVKRSPCFSVREKERLSLDTDCFFREYSSSLCCKARANASSSSILGWFLKDETKIQRKNLSSSSAFRFFDFWESWFCLEKENLNLWNQVWLMPAKYQYLSNSKLNRSSDFNSLEPLSSRMMVPSELLLRRLMGFFPRLNIFQECFSFFNKTCFLLTFLSFTWKERIFGVVPSLPI